MYTVHNSEFVAWAQAEAQRGVKYHAVFCDPPYGISFMGKAWDDVGGPAAFQQQVKQWGEALLPLLYPGALVLMFGGTRTWHRLAAGMEDASFEMWDTLLWLHGQGFPKGQDISKLIDRQNGNEDDRAIVGTGKHRSNNTHSLGTYNLDFNITAPASAQSAPWEGHKTPQLKPAWEPCLAFRAPRCGLTHADLALEYGSGALNVDGSRIGSDLVGWGGSPSNGYSGGYSSKQDAAPIVGRYPANVLLDGTTSPMLEDQTGIPCRFFYCSKASKSERSAGLCEDTNNHPCVKPRDLCRYIATLILPPSSVENRRLLVPFSGSGSEMIGALLAGWDEVTGVEMDATHCGIARKRIAHALTHKVERRVKHDTAGEYAPVFLPGLEEFLSA